MVCSFRSRQVKQIICLLGREYTILFIAIEEMKRRNFTFIQSTEL